MANRRKTKQYKAGLRVREAEALADRAMQQLSTAAQLHKDDAKRIRNELSKLIAELNFKLSTLETDRDEWKESCINANRRFEDAEKKLRDIAASR